MSKRIQQISQLLWQKSADFVAQKGDWGAMGTQQLMHPCRLLLLMLLLLPLSHDYFDFCQGFRRPGQETRGPTPKNMCLTLFL